jgi:predicted DNA binding CopG/RHH family protein
MAESMRTDLQRRSIDRRAQVLLRLSHKQRSELNAAAKARGLNVQTYLRALIARDIGEAWL